MKEMVKLTVNGQEYSVPKGSSLKNALVQLSYPIKAICGGKMSCGKCKVIVEGDVSPIDGYERELLTEIEELKGVRLACNTILRGDCSVFVEIEESRLFEQDHVPSNKSADDKKAGLCIDVGTTTIAFRFLDLFTGEIMFEKTILNPQSRFGYDVISRIEASSDLNTLENMRKMTIESINEVIVSFSNEQGLAADRCLDKVVISGNTCMELICAGYTVDSLGEYPYTPASRLGLDIRGSELGLICSQCMVYLMPCVSGFIGGDLVSCVLYAGIEKKKKTLIVDIGTNTEICLCDTDGSLYATSAPAGPAFEGHGVLFGSGYVNGAIYNVKKITDMPVIDVLGEFPSSICGTGMISAVARAVECGLIDSDGNINSLQEFNGQKAIFLGGNVWITQTDVRNIQMAKASICAAVKMLIERAEGDEYDLVMAGNFGSSLEIDDMISIGMLPSELKYSAYDLVNGSIEGSNLVLISEKERDKAKVISKKIVSVDLVSDGAFEKKYIDCFPFKKI